MEEDQPSRLSAERALRIIRSLATDSSNLVLVRHARQRQRERHVSLRQIQLCCLRGSLVEGPFMNAHGHWQVSLFRHAAGEHMTCAVAIDWPSQLIIITVY